MENTLGVCILYSTALILKFLNADEKTKMLIHMGL